VPDKQKGAYMRTDRRLFVSLLVFTLFAVSAAIANAQATRTWVSGVGDDVNPCSRTAPCKTFAGAISKTADKGEINCLDPGGFGAVTITKSITLDCTSTQGSILGAMTTGIIVNGDGAIVRIRGLNINGASTGLNGIKITAAASVLVENTVIDGFTLSGIVAASKTQVFVSNSSIRNNATGINALEGATFRLFNNLIYGNQVGIAPKGGTIVSFKNNMIAGNVSDGAPTSTAPLQ
jgi:hypothetical protein